MKRIKLYFIAFLILSIFNKNNLLINASIKDTNNNQNENNSKNQDIQNPENNSDKNYINNWNKIIHLCNDNKYTIAGIGSLFITGAIIYKKLLSNNNRNNIAIDLNNIKQVSNEKLKGNLSKNDNRNKLENKSNINNINNQYTNNKEDAIKIAKLFQHMNDKYNINQIDNNSILNEQAIIVIFIEKNKYEYAKNYLNKFEDLNIYQYLNNKKDKQTIDKIKLIIIDFIAREQTN